MLRIRGVASWTAPAERSGDGAFARTPRSRIYAGLRPHESGVALRFPPQSKMIQAGKVSVLWVTYFSPRRLATVTET